MKSENDEDEFRELKGKLGRLSCIVHKEDQCNHAICTALWLSKNGCLWLLHALLTPCIADGYPIALQALTDSIPKLAAYKFTVIRPYIIRHIPTKHILPYKHDIDILT